MWAHTLAPLFEVNIVFTFTSFKLIKAMRHQWAHVRGISRWTRSRSGRVSQTEGWAVQTTATKNFFWSILSQWIRIDLIMIPTFSRIDQALNWVKVRSDVWKIRPYDDDGEEGYGILAFVRRLTRASSETRNCKRSARKSRRMWEVPRSRAWSFRLEGWR